MIIMGTLGRLKQCQKTIELSLEHLKNTQVIPFPYRAQFQNYFFKENGQLNDFLLDLLPVEKLQFTSQILSLMSSLCAQNGNTLSSASGPGMSRKDIVYSLKNLLDIIQDGLSRKENLRVFYSWQSDAQNSTNRTFIEDALKIAIKNLNQKENLNLFLDQDTRGLPGSPDVIRGILEKIDDSLVFIGDVSIVCKSNTKAFPNPNVLFEVGYAIKSLGDEKIVMVFNTASGMTNELPFDLGLKRQIKYNCPPSLSPEDKKEEKSRLAKDFENAISTILQYELS